MFLKNLPVTILPTFGRSDDNRNSNFQSHKPRRYEFICVYWVVKHVQFLYLGHT